MRTSSPGFECLPLAVTVIFFTSDFRQRGLPAVLQIDEVSLFGLVLEAGVGGEMPFVSFSSYLEQKGSSWFVCLLDSFAH